MVEVMTQQAETKVQSQREGFLRRHARIVGAALLPPTVLLAACQSSEPQSQATVTANAPATASAAAGTQPAWVGKDVLLPGSSHQVVREVSFDGQNDSFANFKPMAGVGPKIPIGTEVNVDCMMFDPSQWELTPRGLYYHMTGPEDLKGLFTVANTYYNNSDGGTNNRYDPDIPLCPGSPSSQLPPLHDKTLPPQPTK